MSARGWLDTKARKITPAHLFTPLLVVLDAIIAVAAFALGYFARFEGSVVEPYVSYMVPTMLIAATVVPVSFLIFGMYGYVWRQVGVGMVLKLAGVITGLSVLAVVIDLIASAGSSVRVVPIGVILVAATLLFLGCSATRTLSRFSLYLRARGGGEGRNVLILGAGDAGSLLLRDIETQPSLGLNVVGILDDDDLKQGRIFRSVRVIGKLADLSKVVVSREVKEVLVALPSLGPAELAEILDDCAATGIQVRVMPGLAKVAPLTGFRDLREVKIEDLLGRKPAIVDMRRIGATIEGRTILVTGAAGSIGSELCRQVLVSSPAKLVLIDIDESRLYELFLELNERAPGIPVMRICDIRDNRKLVEVFGENRPSVVFHAAAYKHVPLMEIEPDEAVKTNVSGTRNVLEACKYTDVNRFVLISTDKAVKPSSVMGLTKAIAEGLTIDACRNGLQATAVRFGNVLGSRGSVVPLFEEQLRRGGTVKVTHPEVTRYFMTIPEAARLVMHAQALSEGGDVFVLEMGKPVRIVDLAQKMISLSGSDAEIEFTGLRPAEKLHEILTDEGEALLATGADKIRRLNAIPIPALNMQQAIQELAIAARVNDRQAIKTWFRVLLPGFEGYGTNALDFVDEAESAACISPMDPDMETLV